MSSSIAVTETWLKENDYLFNLENYSFLANGRSTKRGGGVGLYTLEKIYNVDLEQT